MIYVDCSVQFALFKSFKALYCLKNNKSDTLTSFAPQGNVFMDGSLPKYCLAQFCCRRHKNKE